MKPTLVVLAAGMGSRYGGLKQLDPVGPGGEVLLDYSVYDAIEAGFGKVVFVIRRDIETVFREQVGAAYEDQIEVAYSFQELEDLPPGCVVPPGRSKPWGTAHAVYAARDVVDTPFGIINADDFYGRSSFQRLSDCLRNSEQAYSLVGFRLGNTLSSHGTVSRGICSVDDQGFLERVIECHDIEPVSDGVRMNREGAVITVDGSQTVSMNMWGLPTDVFDVIATGLNQFVETLPDPLKGEYYIPSVVQERIDKDGEKVKVVQSDDTWLGVTYPDDKPDVVAGLAEKVEQGIYPSPLHG